MRLVHISEVLAQLNLRYSRDIPPELRPLPLVNHADRRAAASDERFRKSYRRNFGS